ncbi:MAG: DUF3482 domain-containing protein, partial [Burkholderiales bacterium]|nr:DUF3482 domain-containing protein [Burkholderiales bacterium]
MNADPLPQTIQLSLVSHTNVGKTTLARTLLGRDIGEVRDEAHVTQSADMHEMVASDAGDRLVLWDTPGFGDSARLAGRLAQSANPLGWFLAQVWDRYRDRAFWSSQQAVRNVREQADVVLYLVNAAEDPQDAGYVAPEMRVLEWIGKPVLVLLNQLGRPRPAAEEQAEVQRWRSHLGRVPGLRAVLAFDAFARCWVQEAVLFGALAAAVPAHKRAAFLRLQAQWLRRRRETYDAALGVLAERLARAALDREPVAESGWGGRLRGLGIALGVRSEAEDSPRQYAMRALAERLDNDIRKSADRLIALHGLGGHAAAEILTRLAKHYALRERLNEGKAAALGGMVTGALAGLKADLASGGLTFGAGLLVGGVLGALGAAGLARGYNLARGAGATTVGWTDEVLDELAVSSLLAYLAVAHYGRGRGDWAASEYPAHWQATVAAAYAQQQEAFAHVWSLRGDADTTGAIASALKDALAAAAGDALRRLYP